MTKIAILKKIDGFIAGLLCMIALAYWFPGIGGTNSTIKLETISGIGISLIFFFYGLKLSPHEMKKGLSNYRLHILVQTATFLIFPILVLILKPLIRSEEQNTLWLALFFMAALPSTVSSSVVMVSIARGNIPGAIFNASISGLIGIIITPVWIGLFMDTTNGDFNFWDSILSLVIKILLPVFIGLLLNKHLGKYARKHSKFLTLFDKSIILSIVYNSFSKSFSANLFQSINLSYLTITALVIIILFILVYGIIFGITRWLKFSREDSITAIFCGSKKSLVHGTVMTNVLFKNMATQGIFIVPIMVYHSLQLIAISFIAQRMGKNK
ncbi:bile acid:sodium symporter family protein [Plebeiibacterium marinum]|uniref:Bile acid:sodium symporter n=1 Tax=Plebeiibacterium marinum TaxID=2992111 RepID=A0AAE3MAE0_9BACT|nr:bile acid:sodium symporter family protein [Plebeiobacterium marinum]MCW3804060.1 bile acid:sodium symporter [Plebeiobacterium marinum]